MYSTFKCNQNRMALRSPTACEELQARTVYRGRHSRCNMLSRVQKISFTFRYLWRKRQRERERKRERDMKRLLGNKSNIFPWVCSGIRGGTVENSVLLGYCASSQGVRFRYTVSKKLGNEIFSDGAQYAGRQESSNFFQLFGLTFTFIQNEQHLGKHTP
jgi:hypothetical protein